MRTGRVFVVALVLLFAFAAQMIAAEKPRRLADRELDAITAGNEPENDATEAAGGVIVANNSEAILNNSGSVELGDGAQQETRALNLVNSASSGVANGVNVWDGRLEAGSAEAELDVDQSNQIFQTEGRTASLPSYSRPEPNVDLHDVGSSSFSSETSTSESTVNTNLHTLETTRELTSSGSVDTMTTVVGQTIQAGKGVAGSGDVHVFFDGGDVSFTATAGVGGVLEGELRLEWGLPELSVDFNGSICAVMSGSCTSNGSLSETSSELTDQSTSWELTSSTSESASETHDLTQSVRAPILITDAKAEFIVVDDATLESNRDFSVLLGGTSQQNARALNLVNAAGSMVANGVNVSRTPSLSGPELDLNQVNIIFQRM
jgi:hypothetical protein